MSQSIRVECLISIRVYFVLDSNREMNNNRNERKGIEDSAEIC